MLAVSAVLMTPAASALAASCGTGSFEAWLADLKTEAAAKGIAPSAIASGLNGVTLDRAILARDHSQQVFSQSFEEFSGRMVPPRLGRGANMMKQYGSVLGRIEKTYGVPGNEIWWWRSGDWRPTSASIPENFPPCDRWRPWLTIAGDRRCFGPN